MSDIQKPASSAPSASSYQAVLEKICSDIYGTAQLTYFVLDRSGRIEKWGGRLSALGIAPAGISRPITDLLPFMTGILPLKGSSIEFTGVAMKNGARLDAILFSMKSQYGLVLWASGRPPGNLDMLRNRSDLCGQGEQQFLQDFCLALDIAVLEMDPKGHFVLIGTPPAWVSQLPQTDKTISGQPCEDDLFSFLGRFIQQARVRWQKNPEACFTSNLQLETRERGSQLSFQATGITVQDKKLLVISNSILSKNETHWRDQRYDSAGRHKGPVKLKAAVHETVCIVKNWLPADIGMNISLSSHAHVMATPAQIHQLAMNLCINAAQAMAESGGDLCVSVEDTLMTARDLPGFPELGQGPHAVLTVEDTGCGIPEEQVDQIFDPFYSTRDNHEGSGLGLAVVRSIVSSCNGCLRVNSESGRGTLFRVYLPLALPHPD